MKYLNRFIALSLLAVVTGVPAVYAQDGPGGPDQAPPPQGMQDGPPPGIEPPSEGNRGPRGPRAKRGSAGGPGGVDREARRAKFMQKFDTNGDGILDDAERAQLQDLRARMGKGRRGAGLGGPGGVAPGAVPSGGGVPGGVAPGGPASNDPAANFGGFEGRKRRGAERGDISERRQAHRQKLLQKFDTNGDGTLDAAETEKKNAFLSEKRQQHMLRKQERQQNSGGDAGSGSTQ